MIPRLSYAVTACALTLTLTPTLTADQLPWNGPQPRGPVVFDHPPLNTGGPASDTSFRIDPSPAELWQQLADDILLASPATIRRIVFWGFYGDTFIPVPQPPPITETFRVRFYGARPGDGLPDENNIFYEEAFLDPSRTATGRIIHTGPAPPEFVYQIDLTTPVSLAANTPVWLEIVQLGNIDSHFRWEVSVAERTGQAFKNANTGGNWVSTLPSLDADLAYQLWTIPEPESLALLTLAGLLFLRKRKKGGVYRRSQMFSPS